MALTFKSKSPMKEAPNKPFKRAVRAASGRYAALFATARWSPASFNGRRAAGNGGKPFFDFAEAALEFFVVPVDQVDQQIGLVVQLAIHAATALRIARSRLKVPTKGSIVDHCDVPCMSVRT